MARGAPASELRNQLHCHTTRLALLRCLKLSMNYAFRKLDSTLERLVLIWRLIKTNDWPQTISWARSFSCCIIMIACPRLGRRQRDRPRTRPRTRRGGFIPLDRVANMHCRAHSTRTARNAVLGSAILLALLARLHEDETKERE